MMKILKNYYLNKNLVFNIVTLLKKYVKKIFILKIL